VVWTRFHKYLRVGIIEANDVTSKCDRGIY
jgi:hypothetical protein